MTTSDGWTNGQTDGQSLLWSCVSATKKRQKQENVPPMRKFDKICGSSCAVDHISGSRYHPNLHFAVMCFILANGRSVTRKKKSELDISEFLWSKNLPMAIQISKFEYFGFLNLFTTKMITFRFEWCFITKRFQNAVSWNLVMSESIAMVFFINEPIKIAVTYVEFYHATRQLNRIGTSFIMQSCS